MSQNAHLGMNVKSARLYNNSHAFTTQQVTTCWSLNNEIGLKNYSSVP
jgi:hypothetical protein